MRTSSEDESQTLDAEITSPQTGALVEKDGIGEGAVSRHEFAVQNSDRQQRQGLLDDPPSDDEGRDNQDGYPAGKRPYSRPARPSILPRPSSIARHASFIDEDEAPPPPAAPTTPTAKTGPVAWRDLPSKRQLAILTMARLSEPLTQTSLAAYMFYQLKSFDPTLPDSTITSQAGMLAGSFTAAQFVTAVMWGRLADNERLGRKKVLLIGLLGTCVSCIGFGFSRSFYQAIIFRILGGALNGNVGVMRTMISEIIKEKRFQSRAFLLLPMCFNIGVIIGPILGGLLSDPVASYPRVFGAGGMFGGKDGVGWLKKWPYVAPNLLSAVFLLISAGGVVFGLEETLDSLRDSPDLGLRVGRSIASLFRSRSHHHYAALSNADDGLNSPGVSSRLDSYELESRLSKWPSSPKPKRKLKRLPFSRIWTRNVLCTLLCHGMLALHISAFNNLWYIHLSTPRFDPMHPYPPTHKSQQLPFSFTGGLGMPPRSVGFAMAILGVIGITLQLFVYPRVNAWLGTVRSFRYFLCLFPITYFLAPYLSIVPSSSPPPNQASGFLVWLAMSGVLLIQVIGRTFALPAAIILINNCSPHPSVLGTIHGIAQSVSSAARTIGPVAGGWGYGRGLNIGVVGMIWWSLAIVACIGWVLTSLVREGSGHEIFLEGEEDEEMESDSATERRVVIDGESKNVRDMQGNRPASIREATQATLQK